jgi:hypothetical protein
MFFILGEGNVSALAHVIVLNAGSLNHGLIGTTPLTPPLRSKRISEKEPPK